MKLFPSFAGLLALLTLGCTDKRPVVRACMAVIGAGATRAAELCRCVMRLRASNTIPPPMRLSRRH